MHSGHRLRTRRGRRTETTPIVSGDDRTAASAPVVVVAPSSTELTVWLHSRRHHHPEVVTVATPHVDRQGLGPFAANVLTGLGKRPDATTMKRPAEHVAAAWLANGAATEAIICDAQRISGWLLPSIVSWLSGTGVRPWVVFTAVDDPPHDTTGEMTRAAAEIAELCGVDVAAPDVLQQRFADTTTVNVSDPGDELERPSGLPRLPRCDGIRFRSACRDLVDADRFAAVDEQFTATVADIRQRIVDLADNPDRQRRRPLARMLRDVLETARDTEEMVLFARAAQVACLPAGFLVRVDPVLLTAAAETRPRPGTSRPGWERLHAYRDPDFGAYAALFEAGLDIDTVSELTVDQVADIDGHLHVADTFVDEPGASFVRVLVSFRQLSGADPTAPLFTSHRRDGVRPTTIVRGLNTAAEELGADIVDRGWGRRPPKAFEWLGRHGITVHHLDQRRKSK